MQIKRILFAICFAIGPLNTYNVLGNSKSKGNWTVEETNSTSSLLMEFSRKFNNILEICDDLGPSQYFCTRIRNELQPTLKLLLKMEKGDQDPVQMVIGHGRNCLIRNRQYPEYFYAAGDWLQELSIDERLSLSWLPGWFDDECYWDIEHVERDAASQYRIKSTKFSEYLYGARNLWHHDIPDNRYVFTWRKRKDACEEQCLWIFKIIKTNKNKVYFAIQNSDSREYLYASDVTFETNSRYVFTKKHESLIEIRDYLEAQWIIDCK